MEAVAGPGAYRRPSWGCCHGTYPLHACGRCEMEARVEDLLAVFLGVLRRIDARLARAEPDLDGLRPLKPDWDYGRGGEDR